jgi:hypothetical protein
MNGQNMILFAYVLGLGLLWGYAGALWLESRTIARREKSLSDGGTS